MDNGELEFLGRKDFQVKLRGFRIELEEIESVLNQHAKVRESVVTIHTDVQARKYLVAYVVSETSADNAAISDQQLSFEHELRDYLQSKVPSYMVPAFIVCLTAIPLTSGGKPDRNALPAPDLSLSKASSEPTTEAEKTLLTIWREALKHQAIGVHDNFFELGGDSILSIQIASHCKRAGIELSVSDIVANPTIYELSRHCVQTHSSVYAPQGLVSGRQALTAIQSWFFAQPHSCVFIYNS